MISKFLFNYDKGKRKILSGIVENDLEEDYDSKKRFSLAQMELYKPQAGEIVVQNKGKTGYLVFEDENGKKYLDVNIFNDQVVIQLTDNISHASCYSMDFYIPILDYAGYFGYDDPKFIFSGLTLTKEGFFDSYQVFKSIKDASYCKINRNGESYFVARDLNQNYFLTKKFEDASKVNKNELRRVLIINNFINEKADRADVSFSTFKYLSVDGSYIYAGRDPYKLTYTDNGFSIELEPEIEPEYRLRDVEEIFLQLKDISYLLFKEKSEKSFYLENEKFEYVKKTSKLSYEFVKNPADATLLNDYDIEIVKSAYKLIDSRVQLRRRSKNYFMYSDSNRYTIYDEAIEGYAQGRMVDRPVADAYAEAFDINFNDSKRNKGIILIHDNMYLNIKYISKKSFEVMLTKSAYNASLFTEAEAKAIKDLLGISFNERKIENILLNDLRIYNIYNKKPNISEQYRAIMRDLLAKKTTIPDYTDAETLRVETEKSALEYLRRFYIKSVYDYKELFSKVVTKDTKRVLIIAPKFNLELQGLELALDHKVEAYTLNELKFGYRPEICLENVEVKGTYRLKLQNLPSKFVDSFDIILFGAGFNEALDDFKETLAQIKENNKNIVFINSRIVCTKKTDLFYEFFKDYGKVNRTFYTYEFPYTELCMELDKKYIDYLIKSGNRIHNDVAISKKDSYFSIIK